MTMITKVCRPYLLLVISMFTIGAMASGEKDSLKFVNWQNKDPKIDKAWGISTEKAYLELLKDKSSRTVVVAVIDNGVDVNHEELKNNIWINEGEIPGNGIDDDNNGYIDDIHGWNFLGNVKGENIEKAPMEITRLYKRYLDRVGSVTEDSIKTMLGDDYSNFKKVRKAYMLKSTEVLQEKGFFDGITAAYAYFDSIISKQLGSTSYTVNDLKKLKVPKKSLEDTAKSYMVLLLSNGIDKQTIQEAEDYFNSRLNYHFNLEFDSRAIVGDDEWTWSETAYGNNDVHGGNPDHGTPVAGIIAASRNNNTGIKGIADNVKIMCIRAVPDGDEWDKDVAKAIEYAIDNGADIINMSFGKDFSPQKEFVDNVLQKAAKKDVLFVHSAGNDSENNDVNISFPNPVLSSGEIIPVNWITVGATTIKRSKKEFVASFSNYGLNTVDIFAPGESILSPTPNNGYDFVDGTSFSSPVVSGAAALIKSYYPNLSMSQIKEIILESSTKKDIKIVLPGTFGKFKEIVHFSELSTSGGLINVYKALELAEQKSLEN